MRGRRQRTGGENSDPQADCSYIRWSYPFSDTVYVAAPTGGVREAKVISARDKVPTSGTGTCEGRLEVDLNDSFVIAHGGQVCVRACVVCPREDCPSAPPTGDSSYRNHVSEAYLKVNAAEDAATAAKLSQGPLAF